MPTAFPDFHSHGPGLPVQFQVTAYFPGITAGRLETSGSEDDLRVVLDVKYVATKHGLLDLVAVSFGSVWIMDTQRACLDV
jgi:hypothetical protein